MHDIVQMFSHDFVLRALLGLLLIAPISASMGVHVLSFRMAFFSDAIAHSAFTGVALGLLWGLNPWYATLVFGIFVAILILRLGRQTGMAMDTTIGVIFSAVIALGVVIVSRMPKSYGNFNNVLFGDIIFIGPADLGVMALLAAAVVLFQVLAFNRLLLISVSEAMARSKGIAVRLYETVFAILLAIIVMVSMRAVGLLLVTAFLIVPAAAARNLAHSAKGLVWWSVGLALFSSLTGLVISLLADTSTGATIILIAVALFAMSLLLRKRELK